MSNEKDTDMTLDNEEIHNNDIDEAADLTTDDTPADVQDEDASLPEDISEAAADDDTLTSESEDTPVNESENTETTFTEDILLIEPQHSDESADADVSEETEPTDGEPAEDEDAQHTDEATEDNAEVEAEESDDCVDTAPEKKPEEKIRKIDSLFDFIELFVFTIATVFIITSFFFRYSIVDGRSMMGTLQHNDKLLLSNFMYEPEDGDVIVVQSDVLGKVIVKRVIATEGETVRITRDAIYVDGKKLIEPYVYIDAKNYKYTVPAGKEYIEITIPENEIFVMGDHRNDSDDSRVIGTIPEDAIIGKVIYRFYPYGSSGKIESIRITEE